MTWTKLYAIRMVHAMLNVWRAGADVVSFIFYFTFREYIVFDVKVSEGHVLQIINFCIIIKTVTKL